MKTFLALALGLIVGAGCMLVLYRPVPATTAPVSPPPTLPSRLQLAQEYRTTLRTGESFGWRCPLAGFSVRPAGSLARGMQWNGDQAELAWTPDSTQTGATQIELIATGVSAELKLTLQLNVEAAVVPPEIRCELPAGCSEDTAVTAPVLVVDKNGLPTVLRLTQAPEGMVLSKQGERWQLTWKPGKSQAGANRVVLEAHNGQRVATWETVINVVAVNHSPEITSLPMRRAVRGARYEYRVHAQDRDGEALTYALKSAPKGMAIDSKRGVITWLPEADTATDAEIVVQVLDAQGAADSQSYRVSFCGLERVGVLGETLDGVAALSKGVMCGVTHNRVMLFTPENLSQPVASYWTTSRSDRLFVCYKDFVYLCDGSKIVIIDAREGVLRPMGAIDARGWCVSLALEQEHLVLALNDSLAVYSLTDAAQPRLVASFGLDFQPRGMAVQDGFGYVAGEEAFAVVDLSELAKPKLSGRISIPKKITGAVAVKLPYVYAMGHQLRIFDVTHGDKPQHVIDCQRGGYNTNAMIDGDLLWTWGFNAYQCHNIQNRTNPARGRDISGFVGSQAGAYFLTDDGRLLPWSERGLNKPNALTDIRSIVVYEKYAFVAANGVQVYDLENQSQPRLLAQIPAYGQGEKLVVAGKRLYTSQNIVDISDPAAPKVLRSAWLGMPLAANSSVLYGAHDKVLKVWDVTEVKSPRELPSIALDYRPEALLCTADLLFASKGSDGVLCVYRILADFTLKKIAETQVAMGRVAIKAFARQHDTLYLALCGEGVLMLDISNPEAPKVVSRVATRQQATDVVVCGPGLVAVADGCGGPLLIDFSVPNQARVLAEFPTADCNNQIAWYNGHLYSCDRRGGLQILAVDRKALESSGAKKPESGEF